ncbi:MAG: YCF48-related protein [Ignavibacteria bacterium]
MNIISCLIFSLILNLSLFSQVNWQSQNPQPQVDLKSVYFINTNTGLVCGVTGSIYKTTNAGFSWSSKSTPTTKNLNSIWFYSSTNGIAVGDTGTVITTTDSGENWILQSPVTNLTLTKIFFFDNINAFVVCNSGRILKSTNSGNNWTITNLNTPFLFEIDKFNNILFIGSTNGTYFKSTNLGIDWQQINPGLGNSYTYHVHFASVDTGYLYAGYQNTYRTTNSGTSWQQYNFGGLLTRASYLNPLLGFGTFGFDQMRKTTDGGNSWIVMGPSNVQYAIDYSIHILDNSNIYITGKGGRILHHDSGTNLVWDIIGGSTNSCVDISFANSNKGFVAADAEQFWATTNGGNKWLIQGLCNNGYFEGPNTFVRSVYCKDSLTIYRTRGDGYAGHGWYGTIQVSNDGGVSWVTSLTEVYAEYYKIGGAGNAIMCCVGKLIRNNGTGWFDFLYVPSTSFYEFHFTNENTGIVLGNSIPGSIKKIYSTLNNGANWFVQQVSVYPNSIYLRNSGIGLICCDSGKILRTTDFGFNWTQHNSPTNRRLMSITMLSDNIAWSVGEQGIMIYSLNSGLNWQIAPSYTSNYLNKIIFTDQNTGFVAGSSGTVLKTTDGGLTFVNNVETEVPSNFKLEQNFPNPFNPVTSVRFSVPVESNITIEIFDVSGKLIDVLTEGEYQPGIYNHKWDAANYSSGIYFYRFTAGDFRETRKMILLK